LKVAALIFVQVPLGSVGTASVSISVGSVMLAAQFEYRASPSGQAQLITAATDAGDLRSGLAGGVRVTVVLRNFAIVYRLSEVSVIIGESPLSVSRIAYSTSLETKLYLIMPPSLPASPMVKIFPESNPTNEVSFQFTYWDDRMPVLTSYAPYLVYETGGMPINMTVKDLPVLPIAQYSVAVQQGLSEIKVALHWLYYGMDDALVSFLMPSGVVGKANVQLRAGTEKWSNLVEAEYAAIPNTPANAFQVH
jgi:hypothetical protein